MTSPAETVSIVLHVRPNLALDLRCWKVEVNGQSFTVKDHARPKTIIQAIGPRFRVCSQSFRSLLFVAEYAPKSGILRAKDYLSLHTEFCVKYGGKPYAQKSIYPVLKRFFDNEVGSILCGGGRFIGTTQNVNAALSIIQETSDQSRSGASAPEQVTDEEIIEGYVFEEDPEAEGDDDAPEAEGDESGDAITEAGRIQALDAPGLAPLPLPTADLPLPTFGIGSRTFNYMLLDNLKLNRAGKIQPYSRASLTWKLDRPPALLPAEIVAIRDRIEREARDKARTIARKRRLWQSRLVAVGDFDPSFTDEEQSATLHLSLGPTDYFTFAATCGSVTKHPDLRRHFAGYDPRAPGKVVQYFANGLGVILLALTEDNKLAFCRRSDAVEYRPGEIDLSVAEGVSVVKDRIPGREVPDLFHTGVRGIAEELGVRHVAEHRVSLLRFGVDMDRYAFHLLGLARVPATFAKLVELHRQATHEGQFEVREFYSVENDPRAVIEFLLGEESRKPFGPTIWVLSYLSLVALHGIDATNDVFSSYLR